MEINIKDKKIIEIISGDIKYINPIRSIIYSHPESKLNDDSLIPFYLKYNRTHLTSDKIKNITVNGIQMTPGNIDSLLSDLFFLDEIRINDVIGLPEALDEKADLVNGYVPSYQLPSYVDDVIEGELISNTEFDVEGFIITPERGKIYVDIVTNLTYRWSGSIYVEISKSIALGTTEHTAFRGDYGQTAYNHSQIVSGNPHKVTKTDVGLGNVNNTSDLEKPVSVDQKKAIQQAVNDIQIGGVNLLNGSNSFKVGYSDKVGITSSVEDDGSLKIEVVATGSFFNSFMTRQSLDDSTLKDGDLITISYWMKSPNSTTPFRFYLKEGMGYYDMQGSLQSEYKQFSTTVTYKKANTISIHIFPTKTGTYYLKAIQIEKGNKPTDWNISYQDMKAQLTALSNRITALGG